MNPRALIIEMENDRAQMEAQSKRFVLACSQASHGSAAEFDAAAGPEGLLDRVIGGHLQAAALGLNAMAQFPAGSATVDPHIIDIEAVDVSARKKEQP